MIFLIISYNTEAMMIYNYDDMDEFIATDQMYPSTSEFLHGIIHVKGFTFMGRSPDNLSEIYYTKAYDLSKRSQNFNYKYNDLYYNLLISKHDSYNDIKSNISKEISIYIKEFDWLNNEKQFEILVLKNGRALLVPSEVDSTRYLLFTYYQDDFIYNFNSSSDENYFNKDDILNLISSMKVKD